MKTLIRFSFLTAIIIIASAVKLQAQNAFFPMKTGTVLVYAQQDAKGKANSYTKLSVKNVEGSGSNMTISYAVEILDKNRNSSNPPNEMLCKVIVKDGVVILDMNQMFAGQIKDSQMKVDITGIPMELPTNMQPGQSLKDAEATMSIDMGFMKMETTIKMTEGKCLAVEDVTVAAGTFKCHKITQTVTTTVLGKDIVSRTISWYAQGIGTVKTESYNSKDQLQGSTELVEMNN